MGKSETSDDQPILDEDSPEIEEVHRQLAAEQAEFKRIVLEDPLKALKPASLREVREGLQIVDRNLQTSTRPEERQRRIQELAQDIIKYKTGGKVDEGEAWTPSTALFFRETLWQQGLVPREFLPTKREHLKARLGQSLGGFKDFVRGTASDTKEIVQTVATLPPPETPKE